MPEDGVDLPSRWTRRWKAAVISLAVADVFLLGAIAYASLHEEELVRDIAVIWIRGSELATSDLVERGSGTPEDPYVISNLSVEVPYSTRASGSYGIIISQVEDSLVISGCRICVAQRANSSSTWPPLLVGLAIWSSMSVLVKGCVFEDLTIGVEIKSSGATISNNSFESCTAGIEYMENVYSDLRRFVVSGNEFYETDACIVAGTSSLGPDAGSLVGITVKDNIMSGYERAIYLVGYSLVILDIEITGNKFQRGSGCAIFAYELQSQSITISSNSICNWDGAGIELSKAKSVNIAGNHLDTRGPAVSIALCEKVNVTGNSIHPSTNVVSATQFGLIIADSLGVNVTSNYIFGMAVGIMLLSSSEGTSSVWVHNNAIMFNSIQAIDNSGADNHWDDGHAGNYWSDYVGTDDNHDDIGDTPYVIDSDSLDRYPLMAQPS